MVKKKLRMLPLGGLGEIGLNCLILEWEDSIVLLDCGIQFPDASHPGVELFVPDLSYVMDRIEHLKGVVVTHGHDDHIGAIPYLARRATLDVYCTKFPRGLITHKLAEHEHAKKVNFIEIEPGKSFKVGPFDFTPVAVQHSIIEALAFGIKTPVGLIVHSGDFKHDPTPFEGQTIGLEAFEEFGKAGVHLLFADSTNAEKAGHTVSEEDIAKSFSHLFKEQNTRIIIALFASNIRRIGNLLKLAHEQGKKVVLLGRSMHSYTRLAHEQSSLNIPEDTLILPENADKYPDDKVIILATGSQAEPQSALLRVAHGTHRDLQLRPGDRVMLSSRFIPGNERAISGMISQLARQGADILYESIHQIHVSGHGFQEELRLLHKACKPKFFVPVHGEYRHMAKHADLATESDIARENIFVIEDGQVLETDGKILDRAEKVELKKVPIVQGWVMEQRPIVFTQRSGMAKAGIVYSVLMRDAETEDLIGRPVVNSYGVLFKEGEEEDRVKLEAVDLVESIYEDERRESDVAERIRLQLRRYYRDHACYKPIVITQVFDV
ncbi:MAG: ribonuclease J [Bdellovibrionaceae bacterium]|nr:ribonuclease J [Bdellovibrionales bacterium]MCB9253311.1 ribonuclease J [Pseudobdellovibrionaceae bacterium]